MSEMMDRPPVLRRRAPQPAPDERVDPVDVPSPVAVVRSQPEAVPRHISGSRRRVPTVQIGQRLAVDVVDLLDAAVAGEGITQRQALEEAIRDKWGPKYGK